MFNELSLTKVASIEIARDVLSLFTECQTKARQLGFNELRLHEQVVSDIYSIELYKGYRIDSWLSDEVVNTDLKDSFREILTSYPLLNIEEIKDIDVYKQSEFYLTHLNALKEVWGLGAAFIYTTLCTSLATHHDWNNKEIIISHYYISDNYQEVTRDVTIKHFSNTLTLLAHIDWWEQYQAESLKASRELWEKREELFQNIILCEEVENQIGKIGISKTLFQILTRLKELDEYAGNWTAGDFSVSDVNQKTNLRISPESNSTINKFGSLRKFTVPKQGKKIFDLHIKTGDLRFHFYPDNVSKKIYIGYIGKHLRIASQD